METDQENSAKPFGAFAHDERQILSAPAADLRMVIVIPCHDEPDCVGSLQSLWDCGRPPGSVEVIMVINSAAGGSETVLRQNRMSQAEARAWAAEHQDSRLRFHILCFPDLPPKVAGVGLARKIGMDEAVRRFEQAGTFSVGIIVCYDADCSVRPDYLRAIERHFQENRGAPGCGIYFEHPLSGPLSPKIYEAVAAYELHLRYYVQALRYAGFPHAHHTIGSSMAVRAEAYQKQGGMNKRKAGEDFYFLQKIMALGGFTDLTETTVYPSPRPSERVPFGTGKAVREYLATGDFQTYPLEAFLDLKAFLGELPALWSRTNHPQGPEWARMPLSVRQFLPPDFAEKVEQTRSHSTNEYFFRKRFFQWFNGFSAMKFVHYARDNFYGSKNILDPPLRLLTQLRLAGAEPSGMSVDALLAVYRKLDRDPVGSRER